MLNYGISLDAFIPLMDIYAVSSNADRKQLKLHWESGDESDVLDPVAALTWNALHKEETKLYTPATLSVNSLYNEYVSLLAAVGDTPDITKTDQLAKAFDILIADTIANNTDVIFQTFYDYVAGILGSEVTNMNAGDTDWLAKAMAYIAGLTPTSGPTDPTTLIINFIPATSFYNITSPSSVETAMSRISFWPTVWAPKTHRNADGTIYGMGYEGGYGHIKGANPSVPGEMPVKPGGDGDVGTDNGVYARANHRHPYDPPTVKQVGSGTEVVLSIALTDKTAADVIANGGGTVMLDLRADGKVYVVGYKQNW